MRFIKNIHSKTQKSIGKDFYGFLSHSKNYVTADLFTRGLGIVTVPIFTRLLIPADYGVLAILASFTAIFSIIYGLGVRGSVVRYYYEGKNDFNKYLGTIISLLVLWSLFLSSMLFVFSDYLLFFFQVPLGIIYLGIGIVSFQVFFTLYQSFLQATKQSKKVAVLTIVERLFIIAIAIVLILYLTDEKYYGKAFAIICVTFFVGMYSFIKIYKMASICYKSEYIRYALLYSIPVVFHLLSQYVLRSFDQVIINQLVGKAETGLYSLAYSIGAIQGMISHGMLRAWTPELYERLNKRSYDGINALASKFARLVYLTALTLILFARELVTVLADKKYHEALDIVPIVVISYVFFFLYTMYVNFAFYHKKTHLIAIITVIAGAINIGLNYWLIPIYGYQVAAWTTLLSYASLFIMHYFNVRFIIKPEWLTNLKFLLPNFLILIVFVAAFYLVSTLPISPAMLIFIKLMLMAGLAYAYFGNVIIEKLRK